MSQTVPIEVLRQGVLDQNVNGSRNKPSDQSDEGGKDNSSGQSVKEEKTQ